MQPQPEPLPQEPSPQPQPAQPQPVAQEQPQEPQPSPQEHSELAQQLLELARQEQDPERRLQLNRLAALNAAFGMQGQSEQSETGA